MKRSLKAWIAVATIGVTGGAAFALRGGASEGAKPVVQEHGLVAPGLVEADGDVVSLAFEAQVGRIAEVSVDEGDHVKAGQVVARLDDRQARAQLARAEAALAQAEAQRDLTLAGGRVEEIRGAQAELESARATAWEASASSARAQRLAASSAISNAELDKAQSASQSAAAQVRAAEARHAKLVAGSRVEERRAAEAFVAAARADVELAETKLAHTAIVAPRDGVILRRLAEPGEQVTNLPPTIVLTMADTDHLRLRAEVDEGDLARAAVGATGYATAEAFGAQRFPGHVIRRAGELGRKKVRTDDPRARIDTRILEIVFQLDDPSSLPLGLRMDLHLDGGTTPTAVSATR